ncbi:MAG TPA: hypothetical protein VMM58_02205 [Bacteroidota bacterium]|nr:hypothetical protein [Bacteroidota bacterium]
MGARDRKKKFRASIYLLCGLLMAAVFVAGCKKNDSNPVGDVATTTVSDDVADAADAVSDALASNNGGAIDEVNDVFEIAGGVTVGGTLGKVDNDSTIIGGQYDSAQVAWILSVSKKDSVSSVYYGAWTRKYWLQFRANGIPQEFRRTKGVLADTIEHRLLDATGYFRTPRLMHHLTSLTSDWIVSDINADTVTINGTYSWSGIDTIMATARKGRVLDRTISLTFENVRGPRGSRLNRSQKTSGTIEGSYTATVTVPGKAPYTVTETFTIVLGNGEASFTIGGAHFISDLTTGDH